MLNRLKVFFCTYGFLITNGTFAGTMGSIIPPPNPYNGLYLGGTIGIASLIDKQSTNYSVLDSHHLSAVGVIGGGLVGYDYTVHDPLKLGLEWFMDATELNLSTGQQYTPISSYKTNMRYNTGIRLLPGYELVPGTVGHLIVGYTYGQFNASDNGDYGYLNTHFHRNGFQGGLGIKTELHQHFYLRTDILYGNYGTQTSYGTTTSTPAALQTYTNSLATLEGDLSLIYKFS